MRIPWSGENDPEQCYDTYLQGQSESETGTLPLMPRAYSNRQRFGQVSHMATQKNYKWENLILRLLCVNVHLMEDFTNISGTNFNAKAGTFLPREWDVNV